jgi:hypothetical protein
MIMKIKVLALAAAALAFAAPASAANVAWTLWHPDSVFTGLTGGQVSGTVGGVGVTYSGEVNDLNTNYPSWTPNSTWEGGDVSNAPPAGNGAIKITGGDGTGIDTITFDQAVVNPVIAIWSLGQGGGPASFDFDVKSNQLALLGGGPSAEYNGQALTLLGSTVSGVEGNGLVQFYGTFNSISFTTPLHEYYYDFTVGVAGGGVPEPASWAMMLIGFFGLGTMVRLASRKKYLIAGA